MVRLTPGITAATTARITANAPNCGARDKNRDERSSSMPRQYSPQSKTARRAKTFRRVTAVAARRTSHTALERAARIRRPVRRARGLSSATGGRVDRRVFCPWVSWPRRMVCRVRLPTLPRLPRIPPGHLDLTFEGQDAPLRGRRCEHRARGIQGTRERPRSEISEFLGLQLRQFQKGERLP